MRTIFDDDGHEIGTINLSVKMEAALDYGGEITIIYHTPQRLRGLLGDRNGSFELRQNGARTLVRNALMLRKYLDLQKDIAAASQPVPEPPHA